MALEKRDHRALALWAADCAGHVLPTFETQYPDDKRPREAIEAGRAWARMANGNSRNCLEFLGESEGASDSLASSELTLAQVRAAAFAAHAAARDADNPAARAAARAAAHAAATAHVAGHARRAADYAVKAVAYSACTTEADVAAAEERERQVLRLPAHLRSAVYLPTISPLMARD